MKAAMLVAAVVAAYGLTGRWDYEAIAAAEAEAAERVTQERVYAAYLRGLSEGARTATINGCTIKQMFGSK